MDTLQLRNWLSEKEKLDMSLRTRFSVSGFCLTRLGPVLSIWVYQPLVMMCEVIYEGLCNASDCMGWDKKFIDSDLMFQYFTETHFFVLCRGGRHFVHGIL